MLTIYLLAIATADRPNVVLIMADDLGVEAVGCYGGLSYETPRIDSLADEGLRFDNAYATPLCSPTRAELMTGRSAHRDWIAFGLLNPKSRTFGHLFRDAGYRTAMIGKWQLTSYDPPDYPGGETRRGLGMKPDDSGFDRTVLFHAGETEDKGCRYADARLTFDGETRDTGRYGPDVFTDECDRFIREAADKAEPFFLYYSMALPHWPMQPTPDSPEWASPATRTETSVRYFPDMVEYADRCVGKVVDSLADAGVSDETLVLFYADNGSHLDTASLTTDGWRHGGKGLSTDAGTRVPLIARWPGVVLPGETKAIVGPTDFVATFLDITDSEWPVDIDGVSFLPVLRGQSGHRDAWTCVYDPRPGWDKDRFTRLVFASDTRWKLYDDGRLYDLSEDRHENFPIANADRSDEARAAATRLRDKIDELVDE